MNELDALEVDVPHVEVGALEISGTPVGDAQLRVFAHQFASAFACPAGVALSILRASLLERFEPSLAFNLARVESRFRPRAVSPVGARGLVQLMPATARGIIPGIGDEQIFDPETNVRLGLRHLRWLLLHYKGDLWLSLLAYNRGHGTVDRARRRGINPDNGYARLVLGRRASASNPNPWGWRLKL